MIGYREALRRVLEAAPALPSERLSLAAAVGLVAAEDVVATDPVPPFANSGVDGFAVRAEDVEGAGPDAPVRLRLLAEVAAGQVAACEVVPGTTLGIMTGAPLPPGTGAIVMVEDARVAGDWVEILRAVRPGANVRPVGEDLAAGARVVERGTVLRPADIGLLAEVGHGEVLVTRRARIAVVTTGDELVDVSEIPGPGRIRDANVHALCAQARSCGAVAVPFARVPDRREELARALRAAADAADVIATTGGISMGEYDLVKEVLEELGAERAFWRVAQKPAGPLGFWRLGGRPTFGIPGNPVAAMLVMEEYVRPLLRRMMGFARLFRPEREGVLDAPWQKRQSDGRLHFLRVVARETEGVLRAVPSGPQGSGVLSSLARANALALVPEDAAAVPQGARVLVHLIEEAEDH